MPNTYTTIHHIEVLVCALDGAQLKSEQDALDLIGAAMEQGGELIIIPAERLHEDFFELKTRVAGAIVQKFVTYKRRIVILGDISQYVAQSRSFRDFVYEANKGNEMWFVTDLQELDERLHNTQ